MDTEIIVINIIRLISMVIIYPIFYSLGKVAMRKLIKKIKKEKEDDLIITLRDNESYIKINLSSPELIVDQIKKGEIKWEKNHEFR